MFWKFWTLQTLLDTLFDETWCSLGLPDGPGLPDHGLIEWQ